MAHGIQALDAEFESMDESNPWDSHDRSGEPILTVVL